MNIEIKTIPHAEQRYPTCGDWWEDADGAHFRISDLGRGDWELCIALHELVEWFLCGVSGVTQKSVDAFDREFEKNRAPGNTDEPGNDPRAPYYKQHFAATTVERVAALVLGVDWDEYEKQINALP